MNAKKAVLGALAGFAAGAALGVLFAPDKGTNTRKNISRKGEELADALNKKMDAKFKNLADILLGKTRSTGSGNTGSSEGGTASTS